MIRSVTCLPWDATGELCRCFRQPSLGTAARRCLVFPAQAEATEGELPPAPAVFCLRARASQAQLQSFCSFSPRDENAFKIHTTSCPCLLAPSSTRNNTQAASLLLSVKIQLPPSSLHSLSPWVQVPADFLPAAVLGPSSEPRSPYHVSLRHSRSPRSSPAAVTLRSGR